MAFVPSYPISVGIYITYIEHHGRHPLILPTAATLLSTEKLGTRLSAYRTRDASVHPRRCPAIFFSSRLKSLVETN